MAAANRQVSFQTIADAIQIPVSDVEMWVIEAIASNLFTATIDQSTSMILFTRYVNRSFGLTQWKSLQTKLQDIRKNLSSIATYL